MNNLFARAHALLVATFSATELAVLLRRRLDEQLDNIAPQNQPRPDLMFDVLQWFERRGRMPEFLRAAAVSRPRVTDWQQLIRELPPVAGAEAVRPDGVTLHLHLRLVFQLELAPPPHPAA